MGVIQRQGIKGTVVLYFGMLLGYVNTLWIFPYCLSPEQIGVVRTLFDAASLFLIVASLGVSQITLRFFPHYKNEKKQHHGFLGFLLILMSIGSILFTLLFFTFETSIRDYFGEKSAEFLQYIHYTIPFTIILGLFNVFFYYSSSLYRIVIPNMIQNVYVRVGLVGLVVSYYFGWIPFDFVARGYVLIYLGGLILLVVYVKWLGQLFVKGWNFIGKIPKSSIWEMAEYGGFSILTNTGAMLIFQIDTLMISGTIGLKYAGVYFIALSVANIIEVPGRALVQISVPVLSQAIKDDDQEKMLSLYQKTAITQLVVGGFLFLLLSINIENLFSLIPNGERFTAGVSAFYFVGLAKLVSISIGIGGSFITYAKYYKFNMVIMLVMLFLSIGLNRFLVETYELQGVAAATFFTLFFVTFIKVVFVKMKYDFFPYTLNSLKYVGLLIICGGVNYFLPSLSNVFADIFYRSIIITALFLPTVYYLKLALDLNNLIDKLLAKFGK